MEDRHNAPYPDEEPEYTEEEADGDLLTNREIQAQYREMPWFQELNNLGNHWHPKESENDFRWKSQVDQAMWQTYIALRANGTKYFDHRTDDDDIIMKAWEYLKSDIESYDPRKSELGTRISVKIKPRILDAIAFYTKKRDHAAWADELTQFRYLYPKDPDLREKWADAVIRKAFRFYYRRIDSIANKPEARAAVRKALQAALAQYDPATQSLHKLMDQWVRESLQGDQEDAITFSLDKLVGEDGDNSIVDMIPANNSDPAEIAERSEEFSVVLLALAANYQLHAKNGTPRARYFRLNYTEQLSYFAQTVSLPDSHRQDILKPLEEAYFRYFMQPAPTPLTLRAIEKSKIRTVIGDGQYRLDNSGWNDEGFLPAKAQMGYLAGMGISAGNSTISEHRTNYRNTLSSIRRS